MYNNLGYHQQGEFALVAEICTRTWAFRHTGLPTVALRILDFGIDVGDWRWDSESWGNPTAAYC
jgi:hypothetical protein